MRLRVLEDELGLSLCAERDPSQKGSGIPVHGFRRLNDRASPVNLSSHLAGVLCVVDTVNLNKACRSNGGKGREMALTGWEWIVIAGVLVVFFLWGPNKIPQLARAIGQARREFDRASKELTSPLEEKPAAVTSADDALIDTAKKLGIATEGKTRDEISREIVQKASASKTTSSGT